MGDAAADDLMGLHCAERFVFQLDRAAARPEQTGESFQRRRLARAVAAEQRDQLAPRDAEGHAFERVNRVVVDVDGVNVEHFSTNRRFPDKLR